MSIFFHDLNRKKVLFIGSVALLAFIFFWVVQNRFLNPSRATTESIGVSFDKSKYTVSSENSTSQGIPVNILLTTNPQTRITGATIVLRYDPKQLEVAKEQETFADTDCLSSGFRFVRRVREINDMDQGLLLITRIIDPLVSNEELPSGRVCWGSVVFKPKTGSDSRVSFETTDISGWEIVGPQLIAAPRFDEPRSLIISTVDSVEPSIEVQ